MISQNKTIKTKCSGSVLKFPGKLHAMVTFADSASPDSICWCLGGRGFKVNNPDKLVEILPHFIGEIKYRSFQRQLNMWHFEKIQDGPNKGAYVHPYFVRDNRELCGWMSRQVSLKSTRTSETSMKRSLSVSTTPTLIMKPMETMGDTTIQFPIDPFNFTANSATPNSIGKNITPVMETMQPDFSPRTTNNYNEREYNCMAMKRTDTNGFLFPSMTEAFSSLFEENDNDWKQSPNEVLPPPGPYTLAPGLEEWEEPSPFHESHESNLHSNSNAPSHQNMLSEYDFDSLFE